MGLMVASVVIVSDTMMVVAVIGCVVFASMV